MKIQVLDHGYVNLVECWGHGSAGSRLVLENDNGTTVGSLQEDFEVGIVEAARQSTQGSFRGWDQDAKLLKHLYTHNHSTPFEFSGMVIEVQAPIFVFREWHRHRTQSYNEMSARYAPLPDLYYVPTEERLLARSNGNKQAAGINDELDSIGARNFIDSIKGGYEVAERKYKNMLAGGVPKELARLVMPVGHYSRMRASANLRNWLAFLTLRMDPMAQWEIRQYANAVGQLIEANFPKTWNLFNANSSQA